jgi:uncharacterized protein YegP (UPF0339 family)
MTKITDYLNDIKLELQSDEQGYWHGAYSSANGRTIINNLSYPSASECLEATRRLAQVDLAFEIDNPQPELSLSFGKE